MKVRIHYSDGNYCMVEYTEGHAKAGLSCVEITPERWEAYMAFQAHARNWDRFMLALDNKQYAQDHKEGAA